MSLVGILNRLFSHKEIVNCDRNVYLHRWYVIRTAPFAVFIHKFVRSDEDRALHDHPWNFLVIPIWRGYIEHSQVREWLDDGGPALPDWSDKIIKRRVLPILGTRFRRGTYKHRVELLKTDDITLTPLRTGELSVEWDELPSWSIFIRFREFRDWGFHMPEGWIQWNKFWQDKCE